MGTLWPLALFTPYLPWVPRPVLGGYPWRQEIVVAILLSLTFGLLLRRTRSDYRNILPSRRTETLLLVTSGLFILWIAASAIWAVQKSAAVYQAFHWVAYLLFLALMFAVARRPRALRGAFVMLGAVIWILSSACLIGFWGAPTDLASSTGSLFRYFSGFGEMMGVAIPIFAALALYLRRSRVAALCGMTALFAWLSTLEALERGPIIGALLGISILAAGAAFMKSCRPRRASRAWLLLASFVLVTTLQVAASSLTQGQTSATARIESTSVNEPNTRVRFLFWGIALEMFRAHPFLGVGGSNYSIAYPAARARFSANHHSSALIVLHEEMLVQFAHNEYIQVLAELGVVGFILLLLLCASVAGAFWLAMSRSKQPLLALGAGGGLCAFALSSGASTCSFQWMGGGLMFFFAVALVTSACSKEEKLAVGGLVSHTRMRNRFAIALVCSIILSGAAGIRAGNSILLGSAERDPDPEGAEQSYHSAIAWDPRDASTRYSYGIWLYAMDRPKEAVPFQRYGVESGFNTSLCYSDLAAAETEAGDASSAEKSLAQGVSVYPQSIFLRVRHATALAEAGLLDESTKEYAAAISLNPRVARGWWQLTNLGFNASKRASQQDPNIAKAGELFPEVCILPAIAQYKRHAPTAYPQDVGPYQASTR